MIKGRGGALLREKIVALAANHRVTMIDAAKRVERLGTNVPAPRRGELDRAQTHRAALAAARLFDHDQAPRRRFSLQDRRR